MSEKPNPRTRLVADTLGDDWSNGPASGYAVKAAAHARRRRAVRRGVGAAGVIMAGLAVVFALSIRQRGAGAVQSAGVAKAGADGSVAAGAIVAAEKKAPAYEIISDEQLMAALGDRPVLILPQVEGAPKIVVLDAFK